MRTYQREAGHPDGRVTIGAASAVSAEAAELFARLQRALGDAYRLEREFEGGGMSRLFLARDAAVDRPVVVKLLPPELVSDVAAARFHREVEVTARLQHPHILPVLTAGSREGLLYYVMPFVAGESLRRRLEREGPMAVAPAVRILRETADALAHAHARGVVHRDIKPENILLESGHAILADFGVARAVALAQSTVEATGLRLTGTGMSVGTPGYMAPEQMFGDGVDARSDVYAFGVLAYEALTGRMPFEGPTPQAVLSAQLTQDPPPLSRLCPGVPPELEAAIGRALAREPSDRFPTAAELRDALDLVPLGASTTGFPVAHPQPSGGRRRVQVAAGVVAFLLTGAGVAVFARNGAAGPDQDLVVVAPFDVTGPELALWQEGLVDVLSRNLDGAGPIRTVAPTVVVRRWSGGGADPTTALSLAQAVNARFAAFGGLEPVGSDSVRARVALLDASTNRVIGTVERADESARMDRLTDSLSVSLLRELGRVRPVGAVRHAGIGSASLPALKAFLQGEQHYRRTAWDSARAYYERAIALDDRFALALRREGLALSWQRSALDSLSRSYLLRAGAANQRLAPRDSLLVLADSLGASLSGVAPDGAYLARARRLFATLEEATRRYPSDPEVWFALGDARYHYGYGPGVGVVDREVLRNFALAISLDSAFAPAYIHAIELALSLDDADGALRYARAYLALDPRDVEADAVRLVARLVEIVQARAPSADRTIDTTSAEVLTNAWTLLRRWPDPDETAVRIARRLASRPPVGQVLLVDPALARQRLAAQLAYRGHLQEAAATLGGIHSRLWVELALLGAVPPDSADRLFAGWMAERRPQLPYALPWWAQRGDTAAIRQVERIADSTVRADDAPPAARRRAQFASLSAAAYLALARGDSAAARARFLALPDSSCLGCYLERITTARLLAAAGRDGEAAVLLDERLYALLSPAEITIALERARVAERLGAHEKARDAYALARGAWGRGDPVVRRLAEEAAVALERLGGPALAAHR